MKTKFKSAWHRKTFTEFIAANVHNPYSSRNEYVAAVFLLSADKFLWKKARGCYLTGRMRKMKKEEKRREKFKNVSKIAQ